MKNGLKDEKYILHTLTRRKAEWIGHRLGRNCLIKHTVEGKIEMTGSRVRRRKQLLDDIKKRRGH